VDRGRLRRLLARISDAAFVRRRVVMTEPRGSRFDNWCSGFGADTVDFAGLDKGA
jgi:hypothetical protein